jgi:hypothetical protein
VELPWASPSTTVSCNSWCCSLPQNTFLEKNCVVQQTYQCLRGKCCHHLHCKGVQFHNMIQVHVFLMLHVKHPCCAYFNGCKKVHFWDESLLPKMQEERKERVKKVWKFDARDNHYNECSLLVSTDTCRRAQRIWCTLTEPWCSNSDIASSFVQVFFSAQAL